jgi:hypothetical protein
MPTKTEMEMDHMPSSDWESTDCAAGSQASTAAHHLKQTKKSWVLNTPPRTIDTSKRSSSSSPTSGKQEPSNVGEDTKSTTKLHTFHLQNNNGSTPATEFSTPELFPLNHELPEHYVEMIAHAFGRNADLYQDVLGVSRSASPRAIRIAYFKRGREVLSERESQQAHGPTSASISGHISDLARLRFQAVSMAYEIISNPAWLDAYERCRLITEDDEEEDDEDDDDSDYDDVDAPDVLSDPDSTRSVASMSALRRSSSNGSGRSRKTHTGVRWNEEVEELVFNLDPAEERKKEKKKKKKSKKKHKKKRIAVETDVDLETHLEQLDKEAEQHFVRDFFDDLEQSIEHILSSSFGADDEKHDESDEEIYKQLFPETEDEPMPEEFKTPKQPIQQRPTPDAPKKKQIPRKLDASDIEDDEFEMYKNHRQRRLPKSRRSFDDKDNFNRPRREEAMDGSEPSDEEEDGTDSYVSFLEIKQPAIRASHSYDAAHGSKANVAAASTRSVQATRSPKRGNSAWHASLHSSKRATMDDSMRNNLMFASSEGEQARAGGFPPPPLEEQAPLTPPSPRSPKRSSRRSATRARSKSKERYQFQAPADISVSKNYERETFDDCDSAAYTIADSVSTLSASVVQRHINPNFTNSRYKEGLKQDKAEQERMKEVKEEQERMKQVKEEEANISTTTNADRLNTAMEAVLQDTAGDGAAPSTPGNRSKSSIEEANTEFVAISPTTNPEVDVTSLFCFGLCGDEELAETARAAANAQGTPDDPSFTAFLMVYLNAMATDLARLGHSIHENISGFDLKNSVEINDEDLDGMLTILESEMEDVPADIAKTLSQEFLPSPSSYVDETGAVSARSV